MNIDFQGFPKMPRLSREMVITEKIDGTNAHIAIFNLSIPVVLPPTKSIYQFANLVMFAGSRTRWIAPEDDNAGFAKWAKSNAEELMGLGEGRHFGEWWGQGIQRNYGLKEKRFSLFNVARWAEDRPGCCHVVPALYRGNFCTMAVETTLNKLKTTGSHAAPGFMRPEGVVVFHTAGNFGFKKTIEKDEVPKSFLKEAAA